MSPLAQSTARHPKPARRGSASIPAILRRGWRILLLLGLSALLLSRFPQVSTAAKQTDQSTETSTPDATGAFITVTYIEPINVRAGPSSYDYPVIGTLPVGGTAPALGRSPAGEWIQISFPGGPKGIGWVYAANVSLSARGILPVMEPPPTPTPATTDTINPTYAAALQAVPTATRKPTFTAPPPLQLPTYVAAGGTASGGIQPGWIIIGFAVVGLLGIVISSFRRR